MAAANPLSFDAYLALLKAPRIPDDFPADQLYPLACAGALQSLRELLADGEADAEQKQAAVSTLKEIALSAAAEGFQQRALLILRGAALAGTPAAIQAIYELAILAQQKNALQILEQDDYAIANANLTAAKYFFFRRLRKLNQVDPALQGLTEFFLSAAPSIQAEMLRLARIALPNWGILAAFLRTPAPETREWADLKNTYTTFSDMEKQLLLRYPVEFPEKRWLADLYLEHNDPLLRDFCLKTGLEPSNPARLALFAFLSEQWKRYEELDVDFRLLRQAYQSGVAGLKSRLIECSLRSGYSGWLESVESEMQPAAEKQSLTFSQWERWAQAIAEQNNPEKLWQALPVAPPALVPRIMQTLQNFAFEPEYPEEQIFWDDLLQAALEFPASLPLPLTRQYYNPTPAPVQLRTSPDGKYLTAAFLREAVQVWKRVDQRVPPAAIQISGTDPRNLLFSADNRYLAADWTDHVLRVFRYPEKTLANRFQACKAPVAGLFLSQDDRRIYALEQNGRLHSWGFPEGTPLSEAQLPLTSVIRVSENRAAGQFAAADVSGSIVLYDLNRNQVLAQIATDKKGLQLAGTFQHGILTCTAGETVFCLNLTSGKEIAGFVWQQEDDRILQLCDLIPAELCAIGTKTGACQLYTLHSGKLLASLHAEEDSPLTGLVTAPENKLITAHANGSLREYDLTLLRWCTQPEPTADTPSMRDLDAYEQLHPSDAVKKAVALIRLLLAWRSRFDVEIELNAS